jgi:hypothetical protein
VCACACVCVCVCDWAGARACVRVCHLCARVCVRRRRLYCVIVLGLLEGPCGRSANTDAMQCTLHRRCPTTLVRSHTRALMPPAAHLALRCRCLPCVSIRFGPVRCFRCFRCFRCLTLLVWNIVCCQRCAHSGNCRCADVGAGADVPRAARQRVRRVGSLEQRCCTDRYNPKSKQTPPLPEPTALPSNVLPPLQGTPVSTHRVPAVPACLPP